MPDAIEPVETPDCSDLEQDNIEANGLLDICCLRDQAYLFFSYLRRPAMPTKMTLFLHIARRLHASLPQFSTTRVYVYMYIYVHTKSIYKFSRIWNSGTTPPRHALSRI